MRPTPEFRRPPPDPLEKATAERILSIRRWSEKLFSVNVSRSPAFRFTPGQWVRLGIPSGSGLPGSVIWRPYSMVSADYDEYLEFFSILVPGGAFSRGVGVNHQQAGARVGAQVAGVFCQAADQKCRAAIRLGHQADGRRKRPAILLDRQGGQCAM